MFRIESHCKAIESFLKRIIALLVTASPLLGGIWSSLVVLLGTNTNGIVTLELIFTSSCRSHSIQIYIVTVYIIK